MEKKRHTTASGEDYLEAILVLRKQKGMVRSVDVARHMMYNQRNERGSQKDSRKSECS